MAKFPFTNFFDVNGNSQMDFSEELLAMKVFEDALSEDGTASYDELDSDLDGLDDTGLEDEFSEDAWLTDTASLTDPDLNLHSSNFEDNVSDEDDDTWNDSDEEVLWDDPQKEPDACGLPDIFRGKPGGAVRQAGHSSRRLSHPAGLRSRL